MGLSEARKSLLIVKAAMEALSAVLGCTPSLPPCSAENACQGRSWACQGHQRLPPSPSWSSDCSSTSQVASCLGAGIWRRVIGKGNQERLAPLPEKFGQVFGFWLKDRPRGEFVFARAPGQKPVSAQAARACLRRMLKKAGIEKKISPAQIAPYLRHESPERRGRTGGHPGAAGAREHRHHPDLHQRRAGAHGAHGAGGRKVVRNGGGSMAKNKTCLLPFHIVGNLKA